MLRRAAALCLAPVALLLAAAPAEAQQWQYPEDRYYPQPAYGRQFPPAVYPVQRPYYPEYQHGHFAQYPQAPVVQAPVCHDRKHIERLVEATLRRELCHCGVKDVDADADLKCRRVRVEVDIRRGVSPHAVRAQAQRALHCLPELRGLHVCIEIDD